MGKRQTTCALLAIGVLSMSSKSGDKRTYVWAKAKQTCPFSYWRAREGIQNAQVNFVKIRRQKKKIICRSASSIKACAYEKVLFYLALTRNYNKLYKICFTLELLLAFIVVTEFNT